MRLFFASLAFVEAALVLALPSVQPPKNDIKPAPAIRFPDVVVPDIGPKPVPVVDPAAPVKLTSETVYVVSSDAPFLLFDSPPGRVTITKEAGPLRMRGKFVDGNGKSESRNLTGKYLAIVEAASGGPVELIAVPVGADGEAQATRKTILVEAGEGPQPPPKPDPAPHPKPKPPPVDPEPKPQPAPAGPYFFVTVTESAERTPEQAKVLNDVVFWTGLRTAGHDYRHYDKDDANAIKGGYAKVYADLGPCLVVVTGKGIVARKVPLPKSVADVSAILKELEAK